jgi:hypothetical protein
LQKTILAVLLAAACTPKLDGVCTVDSDCGRADEVCSGGICLRRAAAGSSDGAGGIAITVPASGSMLAGRFQISAGVALQGGVTDVTFVASNPATNVVLGQLVVTAGSDGVYTGTLGLDSPSFGGPALLRAVVHRGSQADTASAAVPVTIDQVAPAIATSWNDATWLARGDILTIPATVGDDRSGVALASLSLPNGHTFAATLAGSSATFQVPGAELAAEGQIAVVQAHVEAVDLAGNRSLDLHAPTLRVDGEPPAVTLGPLASSWLTGVLVVTATADDHAGAGVGSAQLLLDGTAVAASETLEFKPDLALLPPTQGAVTLQVAVSDLVGNVGVAEQIVQVDNVPPAVREARVDSAPDLLDAVGRGWFRGPQLGPGAPDVVVSAIIEDPNLVTTGDLAPVATVGGERVQGTFSAGRWTFSIPRRAGLNAGGPVPVTIQAQDAAGNPAPLTPSTSVLFEDSGGFAAASATDGAFHGPAETVEVTVRAAPPSGFAATGGAVDLAAAAKLAFGSCRLAPDASSAFAAWPDTSALIFKVPVGSCVPADRDGPVPFDVTVTSLAGGAATASGALQVDTRKPVVGNVSIFYPAAAGGPAGWSRDGAHFTRRDSGTLYAFSAYDCHGNVTAALDPGFSGFTVATSVDSTGVLNPSSTCSSAAGVPVVRFTVSGNLSSLPTSLVPAFDASVLFAATVTDALGNRASAPVSLGVTRRLWRAPAAGTVSFLALGARLFASGAGGLYAFDAAGGAGGTWSISDTSFPTIATNAGAPAVISAQGRSILAGDATQLGAAFIGGCSHGDVLTGWGLLDASTVGYSSQSEVWDGTCEQGCVILDQCPGKSRCADCSACWHFVTQSFTDQLKLSGGTLKCAPGPAADGACSGSPSGPASLGNRVFTALPAPLYVGQASSGSWALANGSAQLDSYGAPLVAGAGWPLIDGSSPPNAYLPGVFGTASRVDVVQIGPSAFVSRLILLDGFPGSISDMVVSAAGILYVLSGNVVHAVIADSAGSGTAAGGPQAAAWPSQCHDPCRSSTAGYACPF